MILSGFGGWSLSYLLPVLLVFGIIGAYALRPGTLFRILVVHGGLCLSIILSQYLLYSAGRPFPFALHLPSLLFFAAAVAVVFGFLGRFGFIYALSAFIQQLTLTSIAYYLSPSFDFWSIVFLVVPIYAVCHLLQLKYWPIKIIATLVWGTVSLVVFSWYGDILLNASLHAVLGSLLIHYGILYPRSDFDVKRSRLITPPVSG